MDCCLGVISFCSLHIFCSFIFFSIRFAVSAFSLLSLFSLCSRICFDFCKFEWVWCEALSLLLWLGDHHYQNCTSTRIMWNKPLLVLVLGNRKTDLKFPSNPKIIVGFLWNGAVKFADENSKQWNPLSVLALVCPFWVQNVEYFLGHFRHFHVHAESISCIHLSSNLTTERFWETAIFDPFFRSVFEFQPLHINKVDSFHKVARFKSF